MEQQYSIGEPGTSWSPTTTPGSDIIEAVDIVQQTPTRPRISTSCIPRGMREPVQRRVRLEERRSSCGKIYESFEVSVIDSRASMDGSESSTSAITMMTSAASSCTDPWSSSGGFVEEKDDDDDGEINWEQDEDVVVVPKLEPVEDDVDMTDLADVKSLVPRTPSAGPSPTQAKRPRGRPRKHPKPTPEQQAKVIKGRSKAGCITCRKRKKKCDEAKPGCMNCEKNSVQCEGYPEKTIWKSGKEKAEEGMVTTTCPNGMNELTASIARLRRAGSFQTIPKITLPPMINAVETEGDRMFFEHYITRLSLIFTVEGEQNSAFKNMLLPIALEHSGLMHSILALSSKHIDYRSPYGLQFLKRHPGIDVQTLEKRSQFHHDEAVKELVRSDKDGDSAVVTAATYGQILCLVLQTLSDEKPNGQHRFHLQHYQRLIQENPLEDGDFFKFIHEFFQYHICADELIALPQTGARILAPDDWNLPTTVLQPAAVRLLGVSDGLFLYMSKITNIRNKIRDNIESGADTVVDYNALYKAAEIDAGIRDWMPAWPAGDSRDRAGLLYKQMMWVYLWRTIYPPKATHWKPDARITQAVDDGLTLLASFPPRDPSQTLILAPAFVIGCAAFEPHQREPIREAIRTVKAYTEYRNSDTALEVLEEVWRLMDKKDERSWDWQSIAHGMGMDFLAT
ncbi:fungal-specific transcription factor domain-containing protein [Amylocarpus encephaloides]|uniref:Fungal-specific transcription factor domain-containing protein n=1 Tax=Amylocarpus encephaloides TaxID=45428 RepID=A0A9P7YBL3_9HELO|nr:fungal-specific transcription factor domain-containing protein [Amylocarpus encephaloides]